MKRGQAAMEFLMTYGWAILVVLIAIGALVYFDFVGPGNVLPQSCTLFPGVSCEDFKVTSDGRIEINILNGKGQNLEDVAVKLSSAETELEICELECVDGCEGNTVLDGVVSKWVAEDCVSGLVVGEKFKTNIVFEYSLTGDGLRHTKEGQMVSLVETGSIETGSGPESSPWSYQENADSVAFATWFEGHEEYCSNMTDGDWDTLISLSIMDPDAYPPVPLITTMNLYVNYTKPIDALISSRWEIKSGSHLTYGDPARLNLSFSSFSDCWSQEPLMLRSYISHWYGHGGETTYFYCYDGTNWVQMNEDWAPLSSDATFYEEGMWWESAS